VLDDDEETIERVAFEGDGCAISQASASMLSEQLQGLTVEELREMDRDDVTEMLGVDIYADAREVCRPRGEGRTGRCRPLLRRNGRGKNHARRVKPTSGALFLHTPEVYIR
jgi:NifU homolog involved in Fe-S cluster formation